MVWPFKNITSFIFRATRVLYDGGLLVEPSGSAAMAALLSQKLPSNIEKGAQIVVLITGSNVTPQELYQILS